MSWHPDQLSERIAAGPPGYASLYQALGLPDERLRRYLAVHEAGHAVIGVVGGGRVGYMKIAADLGYGPAADDPHIPDHGAAVISWRPTTVKIEAHLRMVIAGDAAQHIWLREIGLWNSDRAWAVEILNVHDRRVAVEAVRGVGGELAFAEPCPRGATSWPALRAQTDSLLARHWPLVLNLAQLLDERNYLDGAAVHALIQSAHLPRT